MSEGNLDLNVLHSFADTVEPPQDNTIAFSQQDAKNTRLDEWKTSIEGKLQQLITVAAHLRNIITEAKTNVKKEYYKKKFKRVNDEVMKLVTSLQQIEQLKAQINAPAEGAKNEDTQATPTN